VLVDENDRVVGTAPRTEVRARNLLHRGIAILVRNSAGEIFVHRRTAMKDVFSSCYDMFIAGMVSAGETYEECALRELREELGISEAALEFLFKHYYIGPENHCWNAIFRTTWDGPIVTQPEEIEWGSFLAPETLTERIGQWEFTPDGLEAYERFKHWSMTKRAL
jgi:mutator protein MutT